MGDADEGFTVIRHSQKLCSSSNNVVFEAAHHVGEVVLEVRREPVECERRKYFVKMKQKQLRTAALKERKL